MFGEESLLGQNELKIDTKGRIFIPIETKREVGERLVLLYDEDLNIYKIYSYKKLEEKLKELNKMILNAKNKTDEIYYKKKLYEISKSILKCSKVDSQGRIIIGKIFDEQNKVLSIGCEDHLVIEKVKTKK